MTENGVIQFGSEEFPTNLLAADGWNSTPNRRTELSAYRDGNVYLHRVTSPNYKTTITFTTTPLSANDKQTIQGIINRAMINPVERRVSVTYRNEETNEISSGVFYIADVTYQSMGVFGGERWYKPITFELTEY